MGTKWEIGEEIEEVSDSRKAVESLFPGVQVTSTRRPKNHPLSIKNPKSEHIDRDDTIDVAPIPGMTFNQYLDGLRKGGYEVLSSRDEATNPIKGLTTGPHWHARIAKRKEAFVDEVKTPGVIEAQGGTTQWEIGGPVSQEVRKGATIGDAPAVVSQEDAKSGWDRFTHAFKGNAQYGFPGLAARKIMDWTDYGMGELKKANPNASPDELETLHEAAIAESQKTLREQYEAESSKDPAWRPDEDWVDNILSGRWAAAVPGIMLGQAGPEMLIAPGSGPLARIGSQAAVNAGADAGYQGLDIAEGVADEFSPEQMLISGAAGAGFQGVGEIIGAVAKRLGGRVIETEGGPMIEIKEANGTTSIINPAELNREEGLTGVVTDETTGLEFRDAPIDVIDYGQADRLEGTVTDYGRPDSLQDEPKSDIDWNAVLGREDERPSADIIPFPVKEAPAPRNPNEPEFLIPDNENPLGSRVAQQPEQFKREMGRDETFSRVDGSGKDDSHNVRTYTQAEAEQLIRERLGVEPTKSANENFTEVPVYKRAAQNIPNPDNLDGPNGRGKAGMIPNPDELDNMVVRPDPNQVVRPRTEAAPAVTVQKDALIGKVTPKKPKVQADAKVGKVTPTAKAVGNYVADLTSGWKNGPDIHVVQKASQLPDNVRQSVVDDGATKSPSFLGSDGKIYMIADNIKNESWAKAAVFHEALGHAGLANKFREDLDTFLTDLYDSNPKIAKETDEWMGRHKGAYDGDTTRAVEEVLALKSNKGLLDPSLRNRLSAYIRKWLRDLGLKVKISDREVLGILELAQKTVTEGKKTTAPTSGNKYINPEDLDEVEEPKYIGNLNIDKIKTNRPQVRELLKTVADELEEINGKPEALSHDDIRDFAASAGTTYKKLQKMKLDDPKVVFAFRQHFTRTAEKAVDLANKKRDGNFTHKDEVALARTMLELADMQETLQGVARNAGRMLNQFKMITTGSNYDVNGMLKYMSENGLGDMGKVADAIVAHQDNPAAVQRVARDITKPFWEDYVTSVRYQFMLSGLGTHARNFMGNVTMLGLDTLTHGAAGVGGQILRFSKSPRDRIPLRESIFRMNGMMKALRDAKTYTDTVQAFKDGTPTYKVNKMEEDARRILPGGIVTEYAKNLLAAGDQFFRPVIENAHINGFAYRQAFQEGVSGYKHIVDRAEEIINDVDHGRRVREMADQQTAELQLIGENTPVGKLFSWASARRPTMNGAQRALRFSVQNLFPFTRVNDNLLKASIRHNILFGWMEQDNRRLWATGSKADRSLVMSRQILGSSITGMLGYWAWTGALEKDDFNRVTLFGVPLEGLDAVGKSASIIAGLVKAYKDGDIDEESYIDETVNVFGTLAREMTSVSALEGMGKIFDVFEGGAKAKSWGASFVSSFVNPAIVRQGQELADPKVRDQTGDGSFSGRTEGKIRGTWNPTSLPVRHDEIGREQDKPGNTFQKITGIARTKPEETDSVALELKPLGGIEKAVGQPRKYVQIDGERINMNAETYQKFLKISGTYIKDTLARDIQTPEWKAATEDEKRKWVKDIRKDSRDAAKDELFSQPEETEWEIE